jgi:hypothetical protein
MTPAPIFYRCGICECLHPWHWNGDCRDDANRFAADEIDAKYGGFNWEERSMQDRVEADAKEEGK